jgi:hypothetical protein
MTRKTLSRRLLLGAATSALVLWFATCRSGAGVNKFSEPSLSTRESKLFGVFLKPVAATIHQTGGDGGRWQLQEAWLEERVQRYESVPIRKGPAGVRLCVRFTVKGGRRGFISQVTSQGGLKLEDECTVFSRGTVVVAFKTTRIDMVPPKGVITIYEENEKSPKDPGKEMLSVDFEIPGLTRTPGAAPGSSD